MLKGFCIVVKWAGAYGLHIYRNLDEVTDAIAVFEHFVNTCDDRYTVSFQPWFEGVEVE